MPPDAVFLAVDPGQHTGFAVVEVYRGIHPHLGVILPCVPDCTVACTQHGIIEEFEGSPVLKVRDLLENITETYPRTLITARNGWQPRLFVIIEQFVFTVRTIQGGRDSHAAVEMFGVFKALINTDYPHFQLDTRQSPADAHNIMTAPMMRTFGIVEETIGTDHAQMAVRHGILAASRLRNRILALDYDELAKWKKNSSP